ncbi:cell division protein DedD [Shewanella profunda]|uniref:cell division protein DedD n=1 Tax=Shewanella profunda TaxID=254793 RepID=UPI00200E0915|nr:cell division protein DedD [Shewanella profunda]MCL1091698.1 cell division protein DedD [Shewanella profunda]
MSSQFHNRLVGTVVLVALGVIFLPDILDGKKERQEEQFAEIPLRPPLVEQRKNADDMFEVLSTKEVVELEGEGADLVGAHSSSDEARLAQAVKTESTTSAAVKEVAKQDTSKPESKPEPTKSEPKKEPAKSTVAKSEPVKKPEVKSTTVAKTEKPKVETAKTTKDDGIKVVSRESIKPGLTLQLGAFSNAANVKALVAQLRKNGFKAYTIPDTPKDGVLTKVFVGPDVSETKLKKMLEDIESLTGLKGRIVPFNPLES